MYVWVYACKFRFPQISEEYAGSHGGGWLWAIQCVYYEPNLVLCKNLSVFLTAKALPLYCIL